MLENKLSVIVSIYNIEQYLPRAIASVCGQTYKNLEIILVNDGSTDSSGRICDERAVTDARIKVLHKKNGGLSSARNAGIEAATGEYIAFLDGDDWIDASMYEDMLQLLLDNRAELAICSYKKISRSGVEDTSTGKVTLWEGREALEVFLEEKEEYQIQNAAWNKLYTRRLLGNLRFPEGKLYEDIVYTTRLLAASTRTVYVDCAYYNYVIDRSDSIMNSNRLERLLTDQIPAYEEKGRFLKEIGEEELYRTHQYFFQKRLLLHYRQAAEQRPQAYKSFLKNIRQILLTRTDWSVYQGRSDRRGEYVRLKLFTLSPGLYRVFNKFNESLLIPVKQRREFRGKKGIIIVLSGGLGNQMFQYALYLYYQSRGITVKIDELTEYAHEKKRKPELREVFGIHYEKATPEEICHWTDSYMDFAARIRRKVFGRRTRLYLDTYGFDRTVLELDNAYLYGWWQSEKYFQRVEDRVRQAFRFSDEGLNDTNKEYLNRIQNCESVGVHLRRGDYLEVNELYGGICTEEYYALAIQKMKRQIPDCEFFLFTNDPLWAREHMAGEGITIVEENDEAHGYLDMYLMSRCKHNIIANSSFSWWAAWLNENPGKRIIAPARWVQGREMPDIYTKEMETCI